MKTPLCGSRIKMLGMFEEANALLMPYHDSDQLYELANWLCYPYFDTRPYPKQILHVEEPSMSPRQTGLSVFPSNNDWPNSSRASPS